MIKSICKTFIIILITISCGESNLSDRKINNEITRDYQRVKGSRVFIDPPENFNQSFKLDGFVLNDSTGFQVSEAPEINFYESTKNLKEANFKRNGIKVHEISKFKLNGFDSYLILIQKESKIKTYNLTFGDSSFVVNVLAFYPTSDEKVGKKIRKSLLSSYYDNEYNLDPFETAKFNIDDSLSDFKFLKHSVSTYMYVTDSFNVKESAPFIMISQLPNQHQYRLDTFKVDMDRIYGLRAKGLRWIDLKEWKRISVNGFNGYEMIATAEHPETKSKCMLYQVIFRDYNYEFHIAGMYHSDFEKNIKETRELISTFNRR